MHPEQKAPGASAKPEPSGDKHQRYVEQMNEAGGRTKSIGQTPSESQELWDSWQKMRGKEPEPYPRSSEDEMSPPTLLPGVTEKIKQFGERMISAMTPAEKQNLQSYLEVLVTGHGPKARDAVRLLSYIDMDAPLMVTNVDDQKKFRDLITPNEDV